MQTILIVDDDKAIRYSLKRMLEGPYVVLTAQCGEEALSRIKAESPDLILMDIKMPGRDGIEILDEVRRARPDLPVIMISGHGTIETAVQATKKGAFDFLEKPLDRDRVLLLARNALDHARLERENRKLKEQQAARILGESAAIRELLRAIDRVAPSHARVLVTGENGTGKELVARRVHDLSPRSNGPFVDVNCAAIPRELLESELFGFERGAFTGAIERRAGKIVLLVGPGAEAARPRFSAYAAANAALVRFAETLAEEVREANIQVNCMNPGPTYTSMTDEILAAGERAGARELAAAHEIRSNGGTAPEKQIALAQFLVSSRSNHLSGKLIGVQDDWRRLEQSNDTPELFTLRRVSRA